MNILELAVFQLVLMHSPMKLGQQSTVMSSIVSILLKILATDKSSRNMLIPAVQPSSGFSARELKKVCGQGALYLRLIESSPSDHEVLFHIYI